MRIATIVSCVLVVACAPLIETPDGRRLRVTSDGFRDYAATVFRRQNAASIAIHDAVEAGQEQDSAKTDALDDADERMLTACEPLNKLAIARRDGREPRLAELRVAADAVPACDDATRYAESLLGEVL